MTEKTSASKNSAEDYPMLSKKVFKARFDEDKLLSFGFTKENASDCKGEPAVYVYEICDRALGLRLLLKCDTAALEAGIYDEATLDEYTLHLNHNAQGEYVGAVRKFYKNTVDAVIYRCTDNEPFVTRQAKQIREFVKAQYGTELEFLWDDSPDCAIMRKQSTGKWYGAILTCKAKTLTGSGDGTLEVINLRADESTVDRLVKRDGFYRAYHMNKRKWFSIVLDHGVDLEDIYSLIIDSYSY